MKILTFEEYTTKVPLPKKRYRRCGECEGKDSQHCKGCNGSGRVDEWQERYDREVAETKRLWELWHKV